MDGYQGVTSVDPTRGLIERKGNQLEAPEHIIQRASGARALYATTRQQNLKRFALWAAIEGLIAGNPPYSQEDLDKHGLSHMTNYNDLSARSRFEKKCLGYFNLTHQAEHLVKFMVHDAEPDAALWASILSINMDKVLRKWKSLGSMLGTHVAQLCKLGLSVLLWPDERDWRPRVTELHRFLVPDQTLCDLDQLTYCFFENDFTAQYLYQVYTQLKNKASLTDEHDHKYFWNLPTLERLLLSRANSNTKPDAQWTDLYDLQVALQNGDIGWQEMYGDGIRLITLLYKEYDGKITHYMFDAVGLEMGFTFLADRQYDDFRQACAIFTVSPGEFTLHSNRGIGHKVFAPCQAKNQLACSLVDMARYSSTPMLRNNSGSIKDPQQIRMFPGVPTDIGAAEFVQNNLGNNIQQVVGALNFLEQNLNVNLGISGDDPSVSDQSNASVSPTQARLQSYREFNILRDEVAHFYSQMDHVWANIAAIMLHSKEGYPGYEFCEEWKRRSIEDGVPEKIFELGDVKHGLPEHIEVKATRVAGDGSTVGLLLGLQEMAPILPELTPKASKAYVRDMVMAALGPDAVQRYTQGMEDPDEVSGGASLAAVENAIMQQGMAPVFSPSNEHKAHFATHLALNAQIKQQVQQQQMDPIGAQKVFEQSVPHMMQHWEQIANSPFGAKFVSEYKPAVDQVVEYATLNRKNAIKMYEAQIKEQQAAQEEQQKVLSSEELKELQVKGDEDRKNRTTADKMRRQDLESNNRADLKRMDIEKKAENDRLKIQLDHGVNSAKAENENSLEQNRVALEQLTKVNLPT